MKIAIVSDDGTTISQHFGRAAYYVVVTVENNQVVSREKRDKLGHSHFANEPHGEGADARGHGYGDAAQSRHARMVSAIADCQVLVARGMGAGAYDSMQAAGIRPVVTDIPEIDDAVQAYLEGRLVDHTERLH
jgi:predicted Fe-Mo cluster-binding NifX family protein